MHILLLGHREIASNVALSMLVMAMPAHRFSIMLSRSVVPISAPPELIELANLERNLCDQLECLSPQFHDRFLSFDRLAHRTGSPARILAEPNSREGLAALAAMQPDLIISVRYRHILGTAAIAIPRRGVLNLHSGLLPGYRGVMATFWAMLNNETSIGCTLHYIVDGTIDTGPVVGRATVPTDFNRTYLANVLSLYAPGCSMAVEAVTRIESGRARKPIRQTNEGKYFSAPGVNDVARFRQAGRRLFDGGELQQFLHEGNIPVPAAASPSA
ncbi:MAG TPA: formyltransferase family protein [Woeseiaceae bacterium]|nr:formyltransferase family protein [Woeseiaceae bacterium]